MLKEAELEKAAATLTEKRPDRWLSEASAKQTLTKWVEYLEITGTAEYGEAGFMLRRTVPLNPFDSEEFVFCEDLGHITEVEVPKIGLGLDVACDCPGECEGHI